MGTIRINRVGLEATRVTRVSKSNLSSKGTKGCRLRIQSDERPIIRRWLASDGFSEADSTQPSVSECDKYHNTGYRSSDRAMEERGQNTPEPMAEVDSNNTGRTTPGREAEVVEEERQAEIEDADGTRMMSLVGDTERETAPPFPSGTVRTIVGGSASLPELVAEPTVFQAGRIERVNPDRRAPGKTAIAGRCCVDQSRQWDPGGSFRARICEESIGGVFTFMPRSVSSVARAAEICLEFDTSCRDLFQDWQQISELRDLI
jgi:hypothetical protein